MRPLRRTVWHVILATWGRGQESIHSNGSEKEHDGEGNVKGSCLRGTGRPPRELRSLAGR